MMQAPVPPPPPGLDPNFVFNELMPIIAFVVVVVVGTVVLRALFRTPLGEALAERIRTRGRGGGPASGDPERVAALEAQVAQQQKVCQSKLAEQQKQIEALPAGLQKVNA